MATRGVLIRFSDHEIRKIDEAVEDGDARSRADFVRYATIRRLERRRDVALAEAANPCA